MIFIDTGYLLALVLPRDQWHARAQAWSEVVGEPLIVTEYVLWEVVNALSQLPNRPKAHAIIDRLQAMPDCEIVSASSDLFQTGVQLHRARQDKSGSLTDCVSFGDMAQRGLSRALTPDHHFEQAGYEALLLKNPP